MKHRYGLFVIIGIVIIAVILFRAPHPTGLTTYTESNVYIIQTANEAEGAHTGYQFCERKSGQCLQTEWIYKAGCRNGGWCGLGTESNGGDIRSFACDGAWLSDPRYENSAKRIHCTGRTQRETLRAYEVITPITESTGNVFCAARQQTCVGTDWTYKDPSTCPPNGYCPSRTSGSIQRHFACDVLGMGNPSFSKGAGVRIWCKEGRPEQPIPEKEPHQVYEISDRREAGSGPSGDAFCALRGGTCAKVDWVFKQGCQNQGWCGIGPEGNGGEVKTFGCSDKWLDRKWEFSVKYVFCNNAQRSNAGTIYNVKLPLAQQDGNEFCASKGMSCVTTQSFAHPSCPHEYCPFNTPSAVVQQWACDEKGLNNPIYTGSGKRILCRSMAVPPNPPDYQLKTSTILKDSVRTFSGPSWNAHLPKITGDGLWEYAAFGRTTAFGSPDRQILIYKRKNTDNTWSYSGRSISQPHQLAGLTMDNDGNLHIAFDCLSVNGQDTTCMPGGFTSGALGGLSRFYHVVFPQRLPDGSINLAPGAPAINYNEYMSPTQGYLGIGYNWITDTTYLNTRDSGADSYLFKGKGTKSIQIPQKSQGDIPLYAIHATSSDGTSYIFFPELIKGWAPPLPATTYPGASLYKVDTDLTLRPIWSDSAPNPDGINSFMFVHDATLDEEGNMYFLYGKETNDACPGSLYVRSYLLKVKGDKIMSTTPAGCHNVYAQIQRNSKGEFYIVEMGDAGVGPEVIISKSGDDGETWKTDRVYIPDLPPEINRIWGLQILKPWYAPKAYNPDVIYASFGGFDRLDSSDYMGTFKIQLMRRGATR